MTGVHPDFAAAAAQEANRTCARHEEAARRFCDDSGPDNDINWLSPADLAARGLYTPPVRMERYGTPANPWKNSDIYRKARAAAAARFNTLIGVLVADAQDVMTLAYKSLLRSRVLKNINRLARNDRIFTPLGQ